MKLNRPYVLGLTGGIACGKSYVARLLRQRGIPVLDADAISRSLTAPGGEALPAVRAAFGDQVFDGDTLNRRALGEVVFADPGPRAVLYTAVIMMSRDLLITPSRSSWQDEPFYGWPRSCG